MRLMVPGRGIGVNAKNIDRTVFRRRTSRMARVEIRYINEKAGGPPTGTIRFSKDKVQLDLSMK